MNASAKPLLAVTMGDPAGTGPELITKALVDPAILAVCRPVVVGDAAVLEKASGYTGSSARIRAVADFAEARPDAAHIEVVDLKNVDLATLERGRVSPAAGEAAYRYIEFATGAALQQKVDAIVTCAINKESLNLAGHHYDGHTGLLSHLCQTPGATMMLAADKLRVSHVSTHLSLRDAIDRVRPERILKVLELTRSALLRLGLENPKIAVAGLNPHAGEHGLFGTEEKEFIEPAIAEAVQRGWDVSGPYPGDTVFFRAMNGEFDAAVAMFHDQGHVAVKMLGIWKGVNITLGLPILRTSVEHGTNFDLAGTGRSDPRSLLEALKLAAQLAS